ncbi:TetR/AcrR family transcriptional regulator [Microbacterium sp. EYE_5]|uniref:TetR/AcrR family transcriptional regulator n=1 Tax=unclassified Microbacterium TaxID=2609290 RepID=UPI002003B1CF|nr:MULTISPECIES: TetR/AcrR family transcriptional regulator [unclassified Microbacterium]MCK6080380.1 TetR/AcrR family transcriptional regulator [Microbacterium sp. EYE_382]MCK6085651.1 TetR/AcrR family transcriptional regulator [Microbacterium sp. EYE_384]MCK6122124.1 TetR/AcrR family transcriptional regulator [Microbacterium sp. EYE_80]MCK6126414.1 TetR/AcrR family transcriptional regulator [Microbacterium sp. EYE_79]MCK6141335.1 TetR/AcrR family transcriptional regulator [Microbacterium sp.
MVDTRRQPRSRPATIARRRDILDAALDIFGAKGYSGGTLQDIADQVGMTHAGILHHFGSKDQLLLEVLTRRDETDVADLEDQHIPGGIDLFRHLVRTAFANARRAGIVQAFAVLSAESVTEDHPGRAYFEERYRNLRLEVTTAFERVCRERGITSPGAIADGAASILAVMDGLQVQWLLDPTAVDLGRSSEFAIEAIVAAVLEPRGSVLAAPAQG